MNNKEIKLFLIMCQLLNSSFPVGGFSHSNALEYYVKNGDVTNSSEMATFLKDYFQNVMTEFEGVAFVKAFDYGKGKNFSEIKSLDNMVYAMKLSKESRSASIKMGRAFYRMVSKVLENENYLDDINSIWLGQKNINYCVIAGFCCGLLNLDKMQSLTSFLFYSISNILQSGIKLIPLGQSEGQIMLHNFEEDISKAVIYLVNIDSKNLELCNFAPNYDISSMNHEFLYTKLYMS